MQYQGLQAHLEYYASLYDCYKTKLVFLWTWKWKNADSLDMHICLHCDWILRREWKYGRAKTLWMSVIAESIHP